jgi:hypothetical protein
LAVAVLLVACKKAAPPAPAPAPTAIVASPSPVPDAAPTKQGSCPTYTLAVGDTWTDVALIEPAWWRESRWTVVAANKSGEAINVWLLRPEPSARGDYIEASVGIITVCIGDKLARGTWSSRGWVARSPKIDLAIALAPGYPEPPVIAISERFVDDDGLLGVSEYFFRFEGGAMHLLDEVVTVDASAGVAAVYDSGFVPGSALTFRATVDGDESIYALDVTSGRFTMRTPSP